LGSKLRAGDVIILEGDLGSGKTTFTQGLGIGLGVREPITSPTFVVSREHTGSSVELVHVDAYRIASLPEWDDLDVDLERGVTVIEWGDRVLPAMPGDHLRIRIREADHGRVLDLTAAGSRSAQLLGVFESSQ
jgi:tRNA threonylcarbamoyladenosine biosynthesis protein TsaE